MSMMMTILHVDSNGRERLFMVDSVDRDPATGELVFTAKESIRTGKVYVMNDVGKTVAVYDFDRHAHEAPTPK